MQRNLQAVVSSIDTRSRILAGIMLNRLNAPYFGIVARFFKFITHPSSTLFQPF